LEALSQRRKAPTFNHAAARAALNFEPTATFQEINQATRPVTSTSIKPPPSPDKSELKVETKMTRKCLARDKRVIAKLKKSITGANKDLKRDRLIIEEAAKKEDVARKIRRTLTTKKKSLERQVKNLENEKEELKVNHIRSHKKINLIEDKKKALSKLLKEEKRTSRLVIKDLMEKAEASMSEVHDLVLALERSKNEFEKAVKAGKDREREAVMDERTWSARVLARCKL
jgi:chromosome segregation ATPase